MKLFNITFRVAVVVITICSLILSSCEKPAADNVLEVSLRSSSDVGFEKGSQYVSVRCAGNWALALVSDGGDVDWADLSVTSGAGDKSNVILTYQKNDQEHSRELRIVLDDGQKWTDCTLIQLAAGDEPGTDPDPDPVPDVNPVKTAWLELPAMDNPALGYYNHSFEMNGKTYRNYSFGWDVKSYLAKWVAYPLCSMYTNGSVDDSDWIPNPLFSSTIQPNYWRSFGFSYGYERGHQIANADRKCCSEANQQTYYYTNATLQHKSFNGAIWKKLEINLRSAASSADTLYVVTGCVVSSSPKYIQDYDGRNVPVPSGYFKAALRYHKKSTFGEWLGAAFYLDHKTYSYETITSAEVMSIDALEAKVGMDFFVNLEAKIGKDKAAAVESQDPLSYKSIWSIN